MRKITTLYRKINHSIQPYNNERGFIMGVVIMLSVILLIIITMAIWSSTNESRMVASTNRMAQDFYNAESGVVAAVSRSGLWMITDFIRGASDETYVIMDVYDDSSIRIIDSSISLSSFPSEATGTAPTGVTKIAEVQIRHIDSWTGTPAAPVRIQRSDGTYPLWEESDDYPDRPHVVDSPAGSTLERHYYVVTAKDVNYTYNKKTNTYVEGNGSVIQVGVTQDFVK